RVEARCPRGGEGVGGSRSDASHQRFPVLILKNKADAPRYIGLVYDHLHGGGTTLREPRTTCSPAPWQGRRDCQTGADRLSRTRRGTRTLGRRRFALMMYGYGFNTADGW